MNHAIKVLNRSYIEKGDLKVRGRGISTDVIEASARAYLSAVNRVIVSEARIGASDNSSSSLQ